MKPDIIILYLIHTGALTVPVGRNVFPDMVAFRRDADENDENETFTIIHWDFRDANGNIVPQPDLSAIAATPEYQTYEANRPNIIEREEAKKEYEKKVIKALALVLMDEINAIRARLVPPLAARTAAQMKTAIENKIASL